MKSICLCLQEKKIVNDACRANTKQACESKSQFQPQMRLVNKKTEIKNSNSTTKMLFNMHHRCKDPIFDSIVG